MKTKAKGGASKLASKRAKALAKPSRPSIGARALASANQALAHARGEAVPGLVVFEPVDVKAVRQKTGLSQPAFAMTFGLEVSAVRDWEQNRRMPERTAQLLLRVIDAAPEVVKKIVGQAA
ncbi:MAG: transcriptional regulator [Hyphomonadaceae bacterium]|nr:transcriptional regulator [Hyphomonadaceae bacterium]